MSTRVAHPDSPTAWAATTVAFAPAVTLNRLKLRSNDPAALDSDYGSRQLEPIMLLLEDLLPKSLLSAEFGIHDSTLVGVVGTQLAFTTHPMVVSVR